MTDETLEKANELRGRIFKLQNSIADLKHRGIAYLSDNQRRDFMPISAELGLSGDMAFIENYVLAKSEEILKELRAEYEKL